MAYVHKNRSKRILRCSGRVNIIYHKAQINLSIVNCDDFKKRAKKVRVTYVAQRGQHGKKLGLTFFRFYDNITS